MTAAMMPGRITVRTVWLSDVHLGSKDCRAHYLLDFLQRIDCEPRYLLGDIVDFWALRRQLIWPAAHYEIMRLIMRKASQGTRVVYVPGNHDEVLRDGLLYCNDGEWVEGCTALVEDHSGALEILHWSDFYQSVKQFRGDERVPLPLVAKAANALAG